MGWTSQVAQQVIIGGGGAGEGLFVYNGTPGKGDLIAEIAAAPGADPFGNAIRAIFAAGVWTNTGAMAQHVEIDSSGRMYFNDSSNDTRIHIDPGIEFMGFYAAGGAFRPNALQMSLAAAAGTDQWGHSFPAGIGLSGLAVTSFGTGGAFAQMFSGTLLFQGTAGQSNPAAVQTGNLAGLLALDSGKVSGGDHDAQVFLQSATASGGGQSQIILDGDQILTQNGNNVSAIFGLGQPLGYPYQTDANTGSSWATGERFYINQLVDGLNALVSKLTTAGIL